MYIIVNALQNLLRNKSRNLMIGVIMLVLIVSSVTALMINNTSSGVIEDYKSRFGSEVTLAPNMQRLQEEARKESANGTVSIRRPEIASEDLIKFGDSEYLQEAIYTADAKGSSEQLNPIDKDKGSGGGGSLSGMSEDGVLTTEQVGKQYYHKIMAGEYADFENGLRELTEGSRMPQNKGECIISQELLENSELSIGDTITVDSALEEGGEPGTETYTDISFELTIVGTYVDITDEYASGMQENAFTNRRNEILTTFDTLSEKIVDGLFGISVDAAYYLKNPDMLDAFTKELHSKGLSDVFDVITDKASYEKVIAPIEGLKTISIAFCIIVLVFGAVIIALLSSIAIRERKYEIGVLRAMGMKKGKVALGLWSETLILTALCLALGLGIGTIIAQPITNVMLDQQIAAIEKANEASNQLPPGAGLSISGGEYIDDTEAQPLKNLNISLGTITLLQIIAIALFLSSLAALIATRKITKYEPIKILMERN